LITYIEPDVCMDAPENNIVSCQLALDEVHYRSLCHSNVGLHLSALCVTEF
jgi:hypothetical protein